jgi:hypothetical protein
METMRKNPNGLKVAILLLVVVLFSIVACSVRQPRCMTNYYRDVRLGIAH